jgi:outer membrane receptor for ferrienterochelin and colicin
MKAHLLFTILYSFLISFAFGQTEVDTSKVSLYDMSLEDLMKLKITTASKKSESVSQAPASVMVITAQMIQARGYHHLEEILHDLPGFDFNKGYGVNYSTIFMRGFRSENSDRFLLFFDGIWENDIWKQTNWISRQYPVSQIKQIEVLYGPASALYGTNAFSGIINVITKKGGEVGNLSLVSTFGSWGRKNVEVSTGHDISEKVSFNATFKYFGASRLHDWDFMKLNFEKDFSQEYRDNLDRPMVSYDGQLKEVEIDDNGPYDQYSFNVNLKVGNFTLTALNWTKKELEGYWYSPYKRRGKYAQWFENNQGYRLTYKAKINKKLSSSSFAMYRSHRILDSFDTSQKFHSSRDTSDLENTGDIVHNDVSTYKIQYKGEGKGYGTVYLYNLSVWDASFEQQFNYTLSDKIDFVFGGRIFHTNTQEDYDYTTDFDNFATTSPRHTRKTYAGYLQASLRPTDNLNITLGGRAETSKDEDDRGYSVFIPRGSAVFQASEKVVFRAQYSEAFQEPDDWHRFATDGTVRPNPSPNLDPEKLQSMELGTILKLGGNAGNVLSISGFRNRITNLIIAENDVIDGVEQTSFHWTNQSSGFAVIYGYEMNVSTSLAKNVFLNANLSGAWNYDANDDLIGDIAPAKINVGVLWSYQDKLQLYPKVNFVSTKRTINWQKDENTLPIVNEVQGYAIVGLNVNVLNMWGKVKGLTFNLKLDNVLNQTYYNPGPRSADGGRYNARVLQPEFNFMTGFRYDF